MIKQGVILNPALDARNRHGGSLEQVLMELALKKKNELAGGASKNFFLLKSLLAKGFK